MASTTSWFPYSALPRRLISSLTTLHLSSPRKKSHEAEHCPGINNRLQRPNSVSSPTRLPSAHYSTAARNKHKLCVNEHQSNPHSTCLHHSMTPLKKDSLYFRNGSPRTTTTRRSSFASLTSTVLETCATCKPSCWYSRKSSILSRRLSARGGGSGDTSGDHPGAVEEDEGVLWV